MFFSPYLLSVNIHGMLVGAVQYLWYLVLQLNVTGILDVIGQIVVLGATVGGVA